MISISAKDAKYWFGRLFDLARSEPVVIEKALSPGSHRYGGEEVRASEGSRGGTSGRIARNRRGELKWGGMVDQRQTESFIAALTELGGWAGNGRLCEALQWDDAMFTQVKDDLVAGGVVTPGGRRGRLVQLMSGTEPSAPDERKPAARTQRKRQ